MTWVLVSAETADPSLTRPTYDGHPIIVATDDEMRAKIWESLEPEETELVEVSREKGREVREALAEAKRFRQLA